MRKDEQKVRKIEPYSHTYEQRVKKLAREYLVIKPCRDCGSPVVDGYVCLFCRSSNP